MGVLYNSNMSPEIAAMEAPTKGRHKENRPPPPKQEAKKLLPPPFLGYQKRSKLEDWKIMTSFLNEGQIWGHFVFN